MVSFLLQQNFLHRFILFSLIVSGKPTRAVPDTRRLQRVTDGRNRLKITLVAMDTGVGFVVCGCMDTLMLSHDARGASMSWPVRPAAGRKGRSEYSSVQAHYTGWGGFCIQVWYSGSGGRPTIMAQVAAEDPRTYEYD